MFSTITGFITRNLWLTTAIALGIAALAALASGMLGKGYYLGEILTLAAMFGGTTMILISQQGLERPVGADDED